MKSKDAYLIAQAYFWAVVTTHFILRLFHLGRNDAYGFPLVSKLDWYIFHALAIDYLWIWPATLPLLITGLFGGWNIKNRVD